MSRAMRRMLLWLPLVESCTDIQDVGVFFSRYTARRGAGKQWVRGENRVGDTGTNEW